MLAGFIIGYLLLTSFIGLWASRRVKTATDFVLAGRNLPPAFNAAALFALWFGSETLFGASGEFLEKGLIGVIEDPFGGVLCFLIIGLFYARRLYRLNILTISDLFRNNFGPKAELLSAAVMVISFFGYVAAQLVALAIILEAVLPLSFFWCLFIGASLVILYTFYGGMWAVSVTDFLQSIVIVMGLLCLAIFWGSEAGGVNAVLEAAPEGHFRFFPRADLHSWSEWLAAWAVLGLGSIASQDLFQRVNAARSEQAAISSVYIGAGLYLVFAMLPLFIVLAASQLFPEMVHDDAQKALPQAVLAYAPVWLQVLFFGSVLSAVMSTCSGALLAPASILAENLIKPLMKKPPSDMRFLWITRFSILGIGMVSLFMAMGRSNIYELVAESSIFGLVSLLVPMTLALYGGQKKQLSAILAMVIGIVVWFCVDKLLNVDIPAMFPGLLASIGGFYVGEWLGKAVNSAEVKP